MATTKKQRKPPKTNSHDAPMRSVWTQNKSNAQLYQLLQKTKAAMSQEFKPTHEHKEEGPHDKHPHPPHHHPHGQPHQHPHGPPHHHPHGPPHHHPHGPPHHHPPPHEGRMQILSHNHFHGSIWFVIILVVVSLLLALSIGLNVYLLSGGEVNNNVCNANEEVAEQLRVLQRRMANIELNLTD
eukprot:467010_1